MRIRAAVVLIVVQVPSSFHVGHAWRSDAWLLGTIWSSKEADRARGLGYAFTATSTTNPFMSFGWGVAGTDPLFTAFNLAVGTRYPDEYLIYAR